MKSHIAITLNKKKCMRGEGREKKEGQRAQVFTFFRSCLGALPVSMCVGVSDLCISKKKQGRKQTERQRMTLGRLHVWELNRS